MKLDIVNDNTNLRLNTLTGGANSEMYFAVNGTNQMRIGLTGAANNFRIRDEVNAADRLNINSSGNVGIGSSNPGQGLDVELMGTVTPWPLFNKGQLGNCPPL